MTVKQRHSSTFSVVQFLYQQLISVSNKTQNVQEDIDKVQIQLKGRVDGKLFQHFLIAGKLVTRITAVNSFSQAAVQNTAHSLMLTASRMTAWAI